MKRICALALALLCLCSCAGLLERDYTVSVPHGEDRPVGALAYRVETYPILMSSLLSYVEEGMDTGVLHFPTTYAGNLSVDLEKARRQVLESEPLGAYGLSDLTYHISRIISYYEVNLEFTYRVDKSQLQLPQVRDRKELTRALGDAAAALDTGLTLLVSAVPDDEDYLASALDAAWDDRPALLEKPALDVVWYPQTGSRRVAEITLTYRRSPSTLRRNTQLLSETLASLTQGLSPSREEIFELVKARCAYQENGGNTAYDALVLGRANEEGMVRAYRLLAQGVGVDCGFVRDGKRLYVTFGDLYLDLTRELYEPSETLPIPGSEPVTEGSPDGTGEVPRQDEEGM